MSDLLAPFSKWNGTTDENNPDIKEIKVVETETFSTEYSTCVKVQEKKDGKWTDAVLSLKSHNSVNAKLLNWWTRGLERGTIRKGIVFKISSWLRPSKNGHTIRDYRIEG